MLYRIQDLIGIGKSEQINHPNQPILSKLESFDILRHNFQAHFCEVLVRNAFNLTNEQVLCFLSQFFEVPRCDVNAIKNSFINNTIICLVRFANFNNYIHFENIVLPHNLTLLNRVNSRRVNRRVIGTVNFSSLVSVNVCNDIDSGDSGFLAEQNSLNVVGEPLVDLVASIPSEISQVNAIRQPVVSLCDCMVDLETILAAENVTLNINDVHFNHRNKCPNKIKSVNIFNQFRNDFNFVHVNSQGILDACHLDELKSFLNVKQNISLGSKLK